jgi:hypothetical protein
VGNDRVKTIWRQEGLHVPQKQPKRARLWLANGSCVRTRPEWPNHVWSYDFVADRTRTVGPFGCSLCSMRTRASVWSPWGPDGSARTMCG